jgi:RecA-superfamily ATPases implicated in signal transduction
MADCVIHLDQRTNNQISTRRLRVSKYRGSGFGRNEYPFTIYEKGMSHRDDCNVTVIGLSDIDQDGIPDHKDVFPNDPNEWADNDTDGIGDNADTDDDNDDMPDIWEQEYGLNPVVNDANQDADQDGISRVYATIYRLISIIPILQMWPDIFLPLI